MMKLEAILIADIATGERLRAVDPEQAKALAFTIERHGLINPITVRRTPAAKAGKFTLVAGAQRLEAFRLLGRTEIEALIVQSDAAEAEMLEISENFFHNDLAVIDRAAVGERFRELWEQTSGPIKSRKPKEVAANLAATFEGRFEEAVAKRLRVSLSAARRLHRIATRIHPELRLLLRGTPYADNESFLLSVVRIEFNNQCRMIASIKHGDDPKTALSRARPPKENADPIASAMKRIEANWKILPPESRAIVAKRLGLDIRP